MNLYGTKDKLESLQEEQLEKIGLTSINESQLKMFKKEEWMEYNWDINSTVTYCMKSNETEAAKLLEKYKKIVEVDARLGGCQVEQHIINRKQEGKSLSVYYWVDNTLENIQPEEYLSMRCQLYGELGYEKETEEIQLRAIFNEEKAMEEMGKLVVQIQNDYVRCGKQVEKIMTGLWKRLSGTKTKSLMVYLLV